MRLLKFIKCRFCRSHNTWGSEVSSKSAQVLALRKPQTSRQSLYGGKPWSRPLCKFKATKSRPKFKLPWNKWSVIYDIKITRYYYGNLSNRYSKLAYVPHSRKIYRNFDYFARWNLVWNRRHRFLGTMRKERNVAYSVVNFLEYFRIFRTTWKLIYGIFSLCVVIEQ